MISLEEFLENAVKCWQFSLDIAWDQNRRHPELSKGRCLKERSFLYMMLKTDQVPVFEKACRLADDVEDKSEMQILLPEILDLMKTQYPPETEDPAYEPGRCFRYALNSRHECYMHIRNAKQPESFLKYPEYVAENLRYIMDKSERENSCDTLFTATWLNSLPKFLYFFPEEWQKNMSLENGEVGWTMGWQGQFINRKGLLNESTAAEFLRTGVPPYTRRSSRCSFESLRKHLKELGL